MLWKQTVNSAFHQNHIEAAHETQEARRLAETIIGHVSGLDPQWEKATSDLLAVRILQVVRAGRPGNLLASLRADLCREEAVSTEQAAVIATARIALERCSAAAV